MCAFRRVLREENDLLAEDRKRHREKIREIIRKDIPGIIADHSIIGQSGDTIIKVPVKGIKEHRFVYDSGKGGGQGEGSGSGEAGDQPGEDIYEVEIELAELVEILFEELELPNLAKKVFSDLMSKSEQKTDGVRVCGIRPRLSKKISSSKRIKRRKGHERALKATDEANENSAEENNESEEIETDKKRFPFHKEDLRYRHITEYPQKESNAVVFFIMDVSGSMGENKKFLVRSLAFLLYRFLKIKYQNVATVFISHHTEAKEVDENTFFHKGESGGTLISSGLNKALEIINERFSPEVWNLYTFYSSDGENWSSDNEAAVLAMNKLAQICNLVCYAEVKPPEDYSSSESMLGVFGSGIQVSNFKEEKIESKEDIWPAMKSFLSDDDEAERSGLK